MTALRPADAAEVAEAVAWADAGNQSLEIVAGSSKRRLGRLSRADHTLDLSRLSGIVDYEPSELVLTARAATPMAEIDAQLRAHGQMLAFEPPDWRALLGKTGEPTLGGTVACNMAGPRRVRAGAARDHFLGFSAVNGWGGGWKAGGRVVKNVTGYDMGKLQAGAYGTLSVLTEISLKTMPRPETSCSVLVRGLADDAAIVLLAAALNSPHEVSAAAHLPVVLAARAGNPSLAGGAATVLRLEGHKPSVDSRALALGALLCETERLEEADSVGLWSMVGAVQPLIGAARVVWRICPTPSAAPAALDGIRGTLTSAEGFYDWGGGLLWLALDPGDAGPDGGAAVVRRAVAAAGGHATLVCAADAIRAEVPVFEPAPPALDALSRRVKAGFDPHGVLNPGRMQKGASAMQTSFTAAQLADPDTAESAKILRSCVHCGFCTATCPTYALLGDELDSPRGRIYLIKDMLENDRPATAQVVKHIDRCLSCLSCMSTCPSGVNYMHLVDHARHHIEKTYVRPWPDRAMRRLLGFVLPRPGVFRLGLQAARLGKPLARWMPSQLRVLLALAPPRVPAASPSDRPQVYSALGTRVKRVALLTGCAQKVLAPQINEATIRLLTRHGCEVVVPRGAGCCGALTHHLGQGGHAAARANIEAWTREINGAGLDAIVINASGCGTTVKDYGFMFRDDPVLAEPARTVSGLARDITEVMDGLGLRPPTLTTGQRVAYHSACSLQHGQQVRAEPKRLLAAAGFTVLDVPEAHLCCGSAGTYNLLQPAIATQLRDRKVANIARTAPDLIAAGNIGCMTQIASGTGVPVVHTAELLDWATGGPRPQGLPP